MRVYSGGVRAREENLHLVNRLGNLGYETSERTYTDILPWAGMGTVV